MPPKQATYVYKTIAIPGGTPAGGYTAALSAEGALGWRLVDVTYEASGDVHFAHFEMKITTLFDSNAKSDS